jgi:hypothetical protein
MITSVACKIRWHFLFHIKINRQLFPFLVITYWLLYNV